MAPSRRKCGGRASAAGAAAARRKWKVGDLVLAKVKGFPAWPATVSEPEKWGYSSDRKKVLVYFFGTQQIAFCNPVDVEEFTKEKKESILTKCHGKGADFVRAVHEIIESYEKLKKQEQAVAGAGAKSGDEFAMMNTGESVGHFALKDQTEAPETMLSSCVNKFCFTGDKNESSLTGKGIAVATQVDVLNERETSSEEAIDNLVVARKPVEAILSAKRRVGVVRSENSASQEKGPEAHWSRSSLKVSTNKFQNFMLPCTNGSKATRDIATKVLQDGIGCLRRSKRIRKSLDLSEGNGTDSPTSISNGSNEENGSEIATVDSDTLTEGSTLESDCKLLQAESVVECCERDVELSQMFDFHAKTMVVKKKRRPNRKRMTNDAPETTRLNNAEGSEIDEHRTGHITPNYNEKLNESYCKENGDEHLPLVKRARVRMGRPSSAGEDLHTNCTSMQSEKKSLDVSNSLSMRLHTSLNCEDDPVDRNSFVMKCGTDNSSLQNRYPQSPVDRSQLWEFNKKQLFAGSMDGEAALPPSKRLQRALEAMSANAANDGQTRGPSTMKTLNNGCYFSPAGDSPDMSMKGKAGNGFEVLNLDVHGGNSSQDGGTFGFSTSSGPAVPKESEKYSTEVAVCDGPARSSTSPEAKHDLCNDIRVEGVENCSGTQTAAVVLVSQSPKRLSPDLRPGSLECKQSSLAQMFPSKEECENEIPELNNCKSEKPVNKLDSSDHSEMSTDTVSEAVRIGKCTRQDATNLLLSCSEGNCSGTAKVGKLPLHVNNQLNGMCEVVKEIKPVLRDSNCIPTPTSVNLVGATAVGPTHVSHCTADSDDLVDKDLSGIQSSSSPTNGLDDRASPLNNIICNIAKSDGNTENNGCCSPDVHLCHVKSQNMAKCSYRAEATSVLASFEAVLGTLTRTRESISRATRIAIDCAKFGIAVKVVEILARNLESESSLHRRVDLFFLVDSITQCSRGLKGDVGYIYPSAIQAVLPRLLLAAAPPGRSALENRRQCLKVLKLWLERRILPDSIVRHHIRDIESLSCSSSTGAFSQFSRRPLRTERAFDDPIREMEGMHVDEYGSNSSIQLPGFCMPPMLKDENEGSDSDGGSFEAVTPEHNLKAPEERERIPIPVTVEKHRHILEDVDGELEMEDVSPSCEAQMSTTSNGGINTAHSMQPQFERHLAPPFASPLAKDVPPLCPPPPPSSPPPPPPPPPPPASLPPSPMPVPISSGLDSNLYMGTHNIKDNLDQSMFQQPSAPRMNPVASDAVYYQAPECGDPQMQTRIPNHASSCSFSSLAIPHQKIQQTDCTPFSNKCYHLQLPQSAPSNEFSYVQADQQMKSPREVPTPSFPNRVHYGPTTDGGNLYTDRDRMKLVPHEPGDRWRFSRPLHSGTYHPDPARGSNPPARYAGLPCEPHLPRHRWGFHPRTMNHREFLPHRPPCGGPIPVPIRAPRFWQPR